MYLKQHTLKQEISLTGTGLHTGEGATITFKPAPENHGYVFKRIDLPGSPTIPADLEHVTDSTRSTTLGEGEAQVHTVEHVLGALSGMQIANVLIEIDGIETPVLDGSALEYCKAFSTAGILEQKANREFYVIDEPIQYEDKSRGVDLAALRFNDFRVTVMVDYNSKVLGIQHATMVRLDDFIQEIAPSRTFVFLHELEALLKAGLIKGGSTDNAMVIVERVPEKAELEKLASLFNKPPQYLTQPGILDNVEPRYTNEAARHKLLDLIGDLALLGTPFKGQILAARPGHTSNIAFGRLIQNKIKQKKLVRKFQSDPSKGYLFDINAVSRILPHRYPFLLVDRILNFEENKIEGLKNVTINEPFFQGHFEGNPIMPGVLILEAMAQVGGVLLLNIVDRPEDHWVYFLAIDKARFRKPVTPGDQIIFKLEMMSLKRNICKMYGRAFVEDVLVAEAEMVASLVERNKP